MHADNFTDKEIKEILKKLKQDGNDKAIDYIIALKNSNSRWEETIKIALEKIYELVNIKKLPRNLLRWKYINDKKIKIYCDDEHETIAMDGWIEYAEWLENFLIDNIISCGTDATHNKSRNGI